MAAGDLAVTAKRMLDQGSDLIQGGFGTAFPVGINLIQFHIFLDREHFRKISRLMRNKGDKINFVAGKVGVRPAGADMTQNAVGHLNHHDGSGIRMITHDFLGTPLTDGVY